MSEFLFAVSIFLIPAAFILGFLVVVPKLVILSTEAEGDEDHIYTIFSDESGPRGLKITSALGLFFPFIPFASMRFDIEGIALILFITALSFFYHRTVYEGYPVFNTHMKKVLAVILLLMTLITILSSLVVIPDWLFTSVIALLGLFWGGYAVYRRSCLIRITKRSSMDAQMRAT